MPEAFKSVAMNSALHQSWTNTRTNRVEQNYFSKPAVGKPRQMVGVDKKGTSGTAGSVDNHYDKVALGLILTTALGGSVRMAQGKYDPNTASMSQEFGNSLAQESARLGNKITDKMLSIKPTIKVPMGKRLNIFVEQDLSLQPYAG